MLETGIYRANMQKVSTGDSGENIGETYSSFCNNVYESFGTLLCVQYVISGAMDDRAPGAFFETFGHFPGFTAT